MRQVRILLSASTDPPHYADAVRAVGGIPTLQYLPQIDTDYDGLILCGGSDIHPRFYGEEIAGSVDIDEKRDEVEFKLLQAFIDAKKPVLGICRGHQLLNVFFGGSLHQHIQDAPLHTPLPDKYNVHTVTAPEGSLLAEFYSTTFPVNSSHHQAVKVLGQSLRPIAHWNDMVEAVQHENLPILGVQWHPERMCFAQSRPDTVDGARIFEYFISLCARR